MKSVDKVQFMETLCIFGTFEFFLMNAEKKIEKIVKKYGEIHVQDSIKQKLASKITSTVFFVN